MSDIPAVECDACRGEEWDCVFDWMPLCDEHRTELGRRHAEKALRLVIPGALHHAKPNDLPEALSQWYGMPGQGLYLYGPVGSGKSHAAAALLKRTWMRMFREGGYPKAVWFNVPESILQSLTAFSQRKDASGLWEAAERASILVVDDIGVETPKEWSRMRLYGLVEHRLHHALPTIVTSNLDIEQLADRLDSPQIASRLSQMCSQVSFAGRKDRRPGMAPPLQGEE